MDRNLVGSIYRRCSIKIAHFVLIPLLPVTYLESSSTAWITVVANIFTTEVQNHKCLVWCAPITYP
jgi:hypothetical protein